MKKTGGTDYMRFGAEINRRKQDGEKQYLLCAECEARISIWEKKFSETCFIPATRGDYPDGHYTQWLSKFLASVVWRTGVWRKEDGAHEEYDDELKLQIDRALENWRQFLLGNTTNPGKNELHFLPIGEFHKFDGPKVPANWNRYTKRYIEYDFVQSDSKDFAAIFVKMGPLAVFGHVTNNSHKWIGSRVAIQHGSFVVNATLPNNILYYLYERARNGKKMFGKLTQSQRQIIEDSLLKDPDSALSSDLFKELNEDIKRFGKSALDEQ